MSFEEDIKLLMSGQDGVKQWNAWRKSIITTPIFGSVDLSGADLRGANLSGWEFSRGDLIKANLSNANLAGANLEDVDLMEACLSGANLRGANLRAADLSRAKLNKADLSEVDMTFAKFVGANLCEANFSGTAVNADLTWADLTGADLRMAHFFGADLLLWNAKLVSAVSGRTHWSDVDLSNVSGLDTIRHVAPSTVGIDTLYKSKGIIPELFLRGCGVPQNLIEYLPSLIGSMQPIQFHSCFISHSSKDKEFCRRLHARMQQEKLRVWFDEKDMPWGQKLHDVVDATIKIYDKCLVVLSGDSIGSEWVKTEIYHAFQKQWREQGQVLFPIRLCDFETIRQWKCPDGDSGKDLAREIREYYIPGDFEHWKDHDAFETAFAKLMDSLRVAAISNP